MIGFKAAVVVILVFIIIYLVSRYLCQSWQYHFNRSNGDWDEDAIRAYNILSQKEDLTGEEHYAMGSLLRYNAGGGDTAEVRQHWRAALGLLPEEDPTILTADLMYDRIAEVLPADGYVGQQQAIQRSIEENRAAVANDPVPQRRANRYFKKAAKISSDGQNVHDSAVNAGLRKTLNKIKTPGKASSASEIEHYLRQWDDPGREDALQALNAARQNTPIGTLADTEMNILAKVWERHKANPDSADDIKLAVAQSLASCKENGGLVCINGRCARYVNALATLDPAHSSVVTKEWIKNEVMRKAPDLLNKEIEDAKKSKIDLYKEAGRYFAGEVDNVDPANEKLFLDRMGEKFQTMISEYKEFLRPDEADSLHIQCMAAIE